jgi:uncharacterized membrane protein
MGRRRDADSGRFTTNYPDQEFIQALEGSSYVTTKQVANSVGCSQNLAYRRLHDLEERGLVSKKKVGQSLAWDLSE